MTRHIEMLGRAGHAERRIHLLELESPESLDDEPLGFDRHCAVLIAWDARDAAGESAYRIAESLLDQGAVSICCWGPECGFVHEMLGKAILGPDPRAPRHPASIITTQHPKESFAEALWYLLWCSIPDDAYEDSCTDALILSIGLPESADTTRNALDDAEAFSARIVAEGEANA